MIINETKVEYANEKEFVSAFDPKEYLDENFHGIDVEDRFSAEFAAKTYTQLGKDQLVLEFGGGPSLFSVASYTQYAREIHFSDYVPESLDEVKKWLKNNPESFNWDNHIKVILTAEGTEPTEEAIRERERQMREKITELFVGDARLKNPIGDHFQLYDFVAAHHCLDVAARDQKEWLQVMKNISSLVRPGGWLAVSITTGTTTYSVGEKKFKCSDLTSSDVLQGYEVAGFDMDSFRMELMKVPQELGREYFGILAALARKKEAIPHK